MYGNSVRCHARAACCLSTAQAVCSTPTPRYTFNMQPFPPALVRQLHLTDEQESHGDLDKGPKAEGPHKEAREHVLASVRSVE